MGSLGWTLLSNGQQSNNYTSTVISAYRDDGDPLPDVVAMDNYYPTVPAYGWVDCPPANTGTGGVGVHRWCRGQYMRFNANYETQLNTQRARRALACHELGHTVGLRHTTADNSCMTTIYHPRDMPTGLNNHDRDHINGHY